MRCPSCGQDNPDIAKFCLNCAMPLTSAQGATVRQERKVITVLFCDLVGFTSASESADPEDVQARLAAYHAMLRKEIERYGGTVEKFIGDAVMAVFGAPVAHEDDVERAVRAGLRLVEATVELNEQRPGLALQVRVGVNTGEALVSLSARPERGEGFVTGDVVNTASRLQGAAPVGGVAVGEQTYAATKDIFDYGELAPAELKGKSEPVRLFHATAARSRFGTDLTRRHTTPLVGREIDLALLKGAFDKARSGPSLQLVTLVGEPGVGKSRLVTELLNHIDSLPELVRFRQGRCLPYGDGITFWAIGEIVKAEAGVLDTDDPDTARSKLDLVLGQLIDDPAERGWFSDRLAPLLGLPVPAGTREETFTAWRRFLEAAAAAAPLVCVIEDLHWADEALLVFVEHMAEWSQGVPMMMVCTTRPELYEKHPNWGAGLRKAVLLSLDPLSDTESAKLISALLGRAVLPAETQALLVERSGGNPLYAEEFVRMLSDRGLIDKTGRLSVPAEEITFPSSVQAIIAARVDTLALDRKGVLQDAAVVGKVFWAGAVAALASRPLDEVTAHLHELSKKELVRASRSSTVAGQLECSFWHAFVRDVAYAGIPRATRASKHRAAARWVEEIAGDRVEEYAEILAHHYLTAARLAEATAATDVDELRTKARGNLHAAARRALELNVPRAEALLRSALEITPPDHEDRPDVEVQLAGALKAAGKHDEAGQFYAQAIAGFERRGDIVGRARARVGLSYIVYLHDPAQADRILAEAIETLEQLPPGPELMIALQQAAGRALVASRDAESGSFANRLLRMLDLGVPVEGPRDLMRAAALHARGHSRFSLGDMAGLDDVRASIELNPNASFMRNNLAILLRVTEGPAGALRELEEAVSLATAHGERGQALIQTVSQLDLWFALGRWDETIGQTPALIGQLSEIGDEYMQTCAEASVAKVQLLRGADSGSQLVASLLPRARRIRDIQVLVPALIVAAMRAAQHVGDGPTLASLLAEVSAVFTSAGAAERPLFLTDVVRLAVWLPDLSLARRFVEDSGSTFPAGLASVASSQAMICETRGDLAQSISHYLDAVERWTTLGDVVERSYALLGLGRSRLAAGDPEGVNDVLTARTIFADLRAHPLIAEADRLLIAETR
jgi:class 3 adenylate cyclase/tetratricopeptide (TPR) repeat protein